MTGLTYEGAGVSLSAAHRIVEAIRPLARSTARSGADGSLGGFGGLFDPRAAGYRDPVLVSGTDSVGTKLRLAIETGIHDFVGIDCVAMCVNDVLVQGAEPLFFLDYLAMDALDVGFATEILAGIAAGCRLAGCALIGGETAEMPGIYAPGDYDLAGFCVGAAERGAMLPRGDMTAGDIVLGLASDGVHSNGFSLVRQVLSQRAEKLDQGAPFDPGRRLAEALLQPTRIYVKSCLAAVRSGDVKGLAHITGGGLVGNIPRILPSGLAARLRAGSWPVHPVFPWLARDTIETSEMLRTFNCGIGMVLMVGEAGADHVVRILEEHGERVSHIGTLEATRDKAHVIIDHPGDWPA